MVQTGEEQPIAPSFLKRSFNYRHLSRLVGRPVMPISDWVYLLDGESVWTLHPFREGVMIHADIPKPDRGKQAVRGAREAFRWAFSQLNVKVVYAAIDEAAKPTRHLAVTAGMRHIETAAGYRIYEVRNGCN